MTGQAEDLAAEAAAYLRSVTLGERLGRFIAAEIDPLIDLCVERGADPCELVLLPTARLLRRAADRLEAGLPGEPGR